MSHTLNILTEDRPSIETVRSTLANHPGFEIVTPDGADGEIFVVPTGVSWEEHRPIIVALGASPDSELHEEYADDDGVPDDLGECRYESAVDSGWGMTDAEAEVAAKIAVDLADSHLGYVDDPQGDGILQGDRESSVRSIMSAYGAGVAAVAPLFATAATTQSAPRPPFYRRKGWWILWAVCTTIAVGGKVARFEARQDAAAADRRDQAFVPAVVEEPELPTYELTVGADGCEVSRTTVANDPHSLQWHFKDLEGNDVLSRSAENELRFRLPEPGGYAVVLEAHDGNGYVKISNPVGIDC
jgi:hypothetical protein